MELFCLYLRKPQIREEIDSIASWLTENLLYVIIIGLK